MSRNFPKQFSVTLKGTSSAPVLFAIFRMKNVSFNLFMLRYLSSKMVLRFFQKDFQSGCLE